MRTDYHISIAPAKVRDTELPRHAAMRLESGRVFAIASALSLPRLWHYTSTTALDGFAGGLQRARTTSPAARLEAGFHGARAKLAHAVDILVERQLPDANLLAVLMEKGDLFVLSAGANRVYVYRRGEAKRLTPKEEARMGLLHTTPTWCTLALEPGDLVLAGSVSSFSMRAVGHLTTVLAGEPQTPLPMLSSILNEPATEAGVGAANLVVRVSE